MKYLIIIALSFALFSCKKECSEDVLGDVSEKMNFENFLPHKILNNQQLVYVDSAGYEIYLQKESQEGRITETYIPITFCRKDIKSLSTGDRIITKSFRNYYEGFYRNGNDSLRVTFRYEINNQLHNSSLNKDSIIYFTNLFYNFTVRNTIQLYFHKMRSSFKYNYDYLLEDNAQVSVLYDQTEHIEFSTPVKTYNNIYQIKRIETPVHHHLPVLYEAWLNQEDLVVQFSLTNGHKFWLKD
jgi:hypothetical protein